MHDDRNTAGTLAAQTPTAAATASAATPASTATAASGHAGAPKVASPPMRLDIERQVRARYAAELAVADICESLKIEVRIRTEIETALAAGLAPPDAAS
jgi:hypothetical protein